MKIVVFSDSHGDSFSIEKVLSLENPDRVIHLGDGIGDLNNGIKVQGNCDYVSAPKERIEVFENVRFFLTHGHLYGVKYDLTRLSLRARELQCEVALYGHTHVGLTTRDGELYLMNPGSIRDSKHPYGFIEIKDGLIQTFTQKSLDSFL
ncbi:YfcE family phosphodiesterase [Guggenheimella bovis]